MTDLRTLLVLLALVPAVRADGPWSTYRGNSERSGCTDGKAGPTAPKVLWAMASKEHFIAAPVPYRDRLFVSGLGFINTSTFYSLDTTPKTGSRIVWNKTSPFLELPTVSSPALLGDRLIFGEGMHQTNGASLYCLECAGGAPLWQLKIDGTLVHLEGSPTITAGRVFLGGGAAGVLSIDPERVRLDGKEMTLPAIARVMAAKRDELQRRYEEARKKKDPFAVPPTDRDLPRAAPTVAWQVGKDKWHVDAPVAVIGTRVLVASAFLDKEKVGQRALFCLDARTGKELWTAPLEVNPWGGPAVSGKTVVVTGSTASMDPALVGGARGIVAAFDLETGKPRWKKILSGGGAIACAALTKDLAVVPCTDGKVRAYTLATGSLRWTYTGGKPFFAPAALSPDAAHVGDLGGVVHAIDLRSGASRWKLDLGADPAVKSPGMIYGGPVLHGGRVYVATCNIAGAFINRPTTVVCIGDK